MPSLRETITAAVYREYDRRIRRASQVVEYGTHHDQAHAPEPLDEDQDSAIANLPPGAVVAPDGEHMPGSEILLHPEADGDLSLAPPPAPPQLREPADVQVQPEDDGEAEITNLPPGG